MRVIAHLAGEGARASNSQVNRAAQIRSPRIRVEQEALEAQTMCGEWIWQETGRDDSEIGTQQDTEKRAVGIRHAKPAGEDLSLSRSCAEGVHVAAFEGAPCYGETAEAERRERS